MSILRVDLQEGFANDAIDVRVNGRASLHQEGVTTQGMLGLATSAEIEVPEGLLSIEIEVPTKSLSKTIRLEPSESPYLGVSIGKGEIEHILSKRPFGYA